MHAGLLARYFGTDRQWSGPCTVILDAQATVQTSGADTIVQSGTKVYAPRLISGRVAADAVCLLPEEQTLVVVQSMRIRQASGEDLTQQTVLMVSLPHVAAIEFPDAQVLAAFGIGPAPAVNR